MLIAGTGTPWRFAVPASRDLICSVLQQIMFLAEVAQQADRVVGGSGVASDVSAPSPISICLDPVKCWIPSLSDRADTRRRIHIWEERLRRRVAGWI